MKSRIERIYDGDKLPDTFNYCIEVNDLSNGFIEQMELVYQSMSDLRLIIVDTLQCIRGQYNNKDGGAYGYDHKEMNKLKAFAKKHNLAILLIHHTSKMDNPNDPFFSISGTRGLTGALERGRMTELIEFAELNGIHINFTPQQLSKEINSLEYQLRMIDSIEHGTVGNGKGSSPHVFKKCKQ